MGIKFGFFNQALLSGERLVVQVVQEVTCHNGALTQILNKLVHSEISFHSIGAQALPRGIWGSVSLAVQVIPALIGNDQALTKKISNLGIHSVFSFQSIET